MNYKAILISFMLEDGTMDTLSEITIPIVQEAKKERISTCKHCGEAIRYIGKNDRSKIAEWIHVKTNEPFSGNVGCAKSFFAEPVE